METDENSVRRPLVESECTGNCNRSYCGFLLDVNADANMVCVPVDDDMEGENVQLRRGVRERKRTSKGEAQIAKKTRVAVAAEQDKEGSAAVGKSDRKRASKEQNRSARGSQRGPPAALLDAINTNFPRRFLCCLLPLPIQCTHKPESIGGRAFPSGKRHKRDDPRLCIA